MWKTLAQCSATTSVASSNLSQSNIGKWAAATAGPFVIATPSIVRQGRRGEVAEPFASGFIGGPATTSVLSASEVGCVCRFLTIFG